MIKVKFIFNTADDKDTYSLEMKKELLEKNNFFSALFAFGKTKKKVKIDITHLLCYFDFFLISKIMDLEFEKQPELEIPPKKLNIVVNGNNNVVNKSKIVSLLSNLETTDIYKLYILADYLTFENTIEIIKNYVTDVIDLIINNKVKATTVGIQEEYDVETNNYAVDHTKYTSNVLVRNLFTENIFYFYLLCDLLKMCKDYGKAIKYFIKKDIKIAKFDVEPYLQDYDVKLINTFLKSTCCPTKYNYNVHGYLGCKDKIKTYDDSVFLFHKLTNNKFRKIDWSNMVVVDECLNIVLSKKDITDSFSRVDLLLYGTRKQVQKKVEYLCEYFGAEYYGEYDNKIYLILKDCNFCIGINKYFEKKCLDCYISFDGKTFNGVLEWLEDCAEDCIVVEDCFGTVFELYVKEENMIKKKNILDFMFRNISTDKGIVIKSLVYIMTEKEFDKLIDIANYTTKQKQKKFKKFGDNHTFHVVFKVDEYKNYIDIGCLMYFLERKYDYCTTLPYDNKLYFKDCLNNTKYHVKISYSIEQYDNKTIAIVKGDTIFKDGK